MKTAYHGSEKHRQQSSNGGKAAHACGRAHQWDKEEARAAGRKGGLATAARRRSDRERVADLEQQVKEDEAMLEKGMALVEQKAEQGGGRT